MGIKITIDQVPLPKAQGWGIVHMEKGQRKEPLREHDHSYDEYVFMIKGRCILRNNGQNFEYRAGDIGLFPRGQMHCGIEALEDTVYLWTRGDTPPESSSQ